MENDNDPGSWNPARVAFLTLQQPVPLPNASLSLGLRQRAFRAYESITQHSHQNTYLEAQPMVQAALLAVALRERLRLTGKWDKLTDELALAHAEIWRTPLACLYGLIEKPMELLQSLLSPCSTSGMFSLALHAFLCNPLPSEIQFEKLRGLIETLPVVNREMILEQLSNLRPGLAAELARQVLLSNPAEPENTPLNLLVHNLHQAEIALIAGNQAQASYSINSAQENARRVQAGLAAKRAKIGDSVLASWQKAFDLAPEEPSYRAGLAVAYLENNNITEANAILDPSDIKNQPELLYVTARLAHISGDTERARQLASHALTIIETRDSHNKFLQAYSPTLTEQLAQLLLLLNLPLASIRAAQLALREYPNDPGKLILLGQAQTSAGLNSDAAEAYQWAVLLDPAQNYLHRELAQCLEAAGKWDLALEERKIMVAAPDSTSADRYALADCALHNNQPAYAADICRTLLLNNPNDGLAHTLLGEALASVGDLTAAQVHFTQASELAPNLPRPWLALANILKKSNQPQKELETLRIASQAIPGSHEIHQELGEFYLASNSPTQALEAFQRAADIAPQHVHIALRLGQTLYQLGHIPQARLVLQQAYLLEPSNIEVAFTYAKILMDQGEPQSALPALETVLAARTHDPAPYVDYSRALLLTHGDGLKATNALRHVLELNPEHNEAQALLGDTLAAEEKYEDSLQAYQAALETPLAQIDEWRARLSLGLGNVALKLDQSEIAITASLEAVHLDPENYRPHSQLAEAYQAAGLIPDAYQSACDALRLAGDNINVMIWYVEKTLEFAGKRQTLKYGDTQQHPRHEELHLHALQTLTRAAEITPVQADLILRIAGIQCEAGDYVSAANNLRRIAGIQTATTGELQQAAKLLLSLNDPGGAIACFENALLNMKEDPENKSVRVTFLSQLAHAHQHAKNPGAALIAIEKALDLAPDDIDLCCDKAQLHLALGDSINALNFLDETISRIPDPRLHHRASIILQAQGKLLKALELAEAGIQVHKTAGDNSNVCGHLECVVQAAEIARALLQPERALRFLQEQAGVIAGQESQTIENYYLTFTEMALANGLEIEAAQCLNKAVQNSEEKPPRLLGLQAQLHLRRGDYPVALSTFQKALQNLGENEPGNTPTLKASDEKGLLSPTAITSIADITPSVLYTLTQTALELNMWSVALKLAQRLVRVASLEPLAHLNLAQVLVKRAEFQYLANDSDLVGHTPGPVALSEGTCRAFDQGIEEALRLCDEISRQSQFTALPPLLARWQIRGNAVFIPTPETAQTLFDWAERSSQPSDFSAALAVGRRMSLIKEHHLSYNKQQSGAVLAQIALCLAEKQPEEAIKALQLAILNEPIRDAHHAIRHYLLARLSHLTQISSASTAIHTAITILPDEPRWYALAAKITILSGDKATAINFLEKAISLEPRYIDHHLDLGKIHLQYADESNPADATQAVKSLEHACRLAPEHPEAWLLLARAHRILGNLEQAAAAAEQSSTLAPEIATSHLIQAEIALQSGKHQIAFEHAQTAFHLQPESQPSAMVLSRALQALNRPAEALAVIDKAIPASEQSTSLTIERIQLLRQSKGLEIALQAANELAELNPDEPTVLAVLADFQADAHQEETAIRTAQKAILLGEGLPVSEQADLRLLLGKLLRRAGQLDQAIHHLDEVIRLAPEKIDAFLELGRTHQDRRQQAQALQMYRHAADIAPRDPRPYLQAGLALKEGKDYLEAEAMLRRAADLAPNDTMIRRQLAGVIAINLVHNPRHSLQNETI
jgi:tetratricopeptide (TPR) repeat protein